MVIFILFMSTPAEAPAHPHVFIDTHVRPEFDRTGLKGFRCFWKVDEMSSAMLKLMFDMDFDGTVNGIELDRLKDYFKATYSNQQYFAYIYHRGKTYRPDEITDFSAEIDNDQFIFQMFFPFSQPGQTEEQSVFFSLYDETFYVDINISPSQFDIKNPDQLIVHHKIYRNKDVSFYILRIHPMELQLSFRK